ncbi:MAG: D-alanyl-D-alanine carboxypeptidase family protein [Oscillospiraceae bacterium]|nr:D-alanyl-D-alanine carboxypeptidase family protein [Oscillospiraceae bacterium]
MWTTSDDKVATVDKAGRIKGVGAGQCKIRVTSVSNPFVFAEIDVTVADPNATSTTVTTETTGSESGTTVSGETGSSGASQSGTAASGTSSVQNTANPTIEYKDKIGTYVNGILIANKTYPLDSGYNPGLDKNAQAAFTEMQKAAAKEGITLTICSGFRDYNTQKALYNRYVNRDGKAEADRYSARPGHSEHQTGLAMDINRADKSFTGTKEQKWLAANCVKYGFIIRYPEGKENITGYMYESWHIRYLGKDLAKKVADSGLTLEEYLGITSKYAN